MVQGVKGLPVELKIFALREVEILGQGTIQVPESGRAHVRQYGTHVSKLPSSRIGRVVIRPEGLVPAEGRLKSGGVNPVGNLLLLRTVSREMRITDQIAPPCLSATPPYLVEYGVLERIRRAGNGKR